MNWSQFKVKGQGHSKTTYAQMSTRGYVLAYLQRAGTYFKSQLRITGPREPDDIIKVMGSKVKVKYVF